MQHQRLPQLLPHHRCSIILPSGRPHVTEHPPIRACKLTVGHYGDPVFRRGRENIQARLLPGMLELHRLATAVQVPPAFDELGGKRGAMMGGEFARVAMQLVMKMDAERRLLLDASLLMYMSTS